MLVARQTLVLAAPYICANFKPVVAHDFRPVRHALVFQILFIEGAVTLVPHLESAGAVDVQVRQPPGIGAARKVEAREARLRCQLLGGVRRTQEHAVLRNTDSKISKHRRTKDITRTANTILIPRIGDSFTAEPIELSTTGRPKRARSVEVIPTVGVMPEITQLGVLHVVYAYPGLVCIVGLHAASNEIVSSPNGARDIRGRKQLE